MLPRSWPRLWVARLYHSSRVCFGEHKKESFAEIVFSFAAIFWAKVLRNWPAIHSRERHMSCEFRSNRARQCLGRCVAELERVIRNGTEGGHMLAEFDQLWFEIDHLSDSGWILTNFGHVLLKWGVDWTWFELDHIWPGLVRIRRCRPNLD